MDVLLSSFTPNIVKDIYVKDPLTSSLGCDIVRKSTEMIATMGFESFTFKKLAAEIHTTEASVYRYFENKYTLLLYLTSYYWAWAEYQLIFKNSNVTDPVVQLKNAVDVITMPKTIEDRWLDQQHLLHIIINESSKSYMIKSVDRFNRHGMYYNYKKMVSMISDIILRINPAFQCAHMLVSTIIEGAHHQKYFARHLPSLTDEQKKDNSLSEFYYHLALSAIQKI